MSSQIHFSNSKKTLLEKLLNLSKDLDGNDSKETHSLHCKDRALNKNNGFGGNSMSKEIALSSRNWDRWITFLSDVGSPPTTKIHSAKPQPLSILRCSFLTHYLSSFLDSFTSFIIIKFTLNTRLLLINSSYHLSVFALIELHISPKIIYRAPL